MGYRIHGRWTHLKAAEEHVNVTFEYDGHRAWQLTFPIKCRRAGLDLDDDEAIDAYVAESFGWFIYNELPASSNPARRLQDLKEAGFTIGTRRRKDSRDLEFMLVPKLLGTETGYEYWSGVLRARIVKALKNRDAFEGKSGNPKHLLPDHKFPEIRWDRDTRRESLHDLSDAEINSDFQLITNQRNQQKREVCRRCLATDERGTPFGIGFFYRGGSTWARDVPRTGKNAEPGCVGCGWYDLDQWRSSLQALVDRA